MITEEQDVLTFKGEDIFKKEFLFQIIQLFGLHKKIVLRSNLDTFQVNINVDDFLNPNHVIRIILGFYPDYELIMSSTSIKEQFFDINDPFVSDYLAFANNWNEDLKIPLPKVNELYEENDIAPILQFQSKKVIESL